MKNSNKITSIFIIASLTISMFVGCGSLKKTSSSSNVGTTNNANTRMTDIAGTDTSYNTGNVNQQTSNPEAMKTLYFNSLKPLVTDGTITKDQSDMVLLAITRDMLNGTGLAGTMDNPSTNSNIGSNAAGNPGTTNNMGSAITTDMAASRISVLSQLVTRGVITQTQFIAINRSIQNALKNNNSQTY